LSIPFALPHISYQVLEDARLANQRQESGLNHQKILLKE
jgi:hypothetical protein